MENPSKRPGQIMLALSWIVGIFLFTQFFAAKENKALNPNNNIETRFSNGASSIELHANKKGHYVLTGTINDTPSLLMIDTGATDVVVPAELAETYNLKPLGRQIGLTANGKVEIQKTIIDKLSIGTINLYNVPASINPGMQMSQPILLGMSAIKRFDLIQKDNILTLTYQP